MKWAFVVSTNDSETIYNGFRLANVTLDKGNSVTVFMLGKGVEFRERSTEDFNIIGQVDRFTSSGGDLLV